MLSVYMTVRLFASAAAPHGLCPAQIPTSLAQEPTRFLPGRDAEHVPLPWIYRIRSMQQGHRPPRE